MVVSNTSEEAHVTKALINALRKRLSTIQTYCSDDSEVLIGSPIAYYVLKTSDRHGESISVRHTGWRALVLSDNIVMLAGVNHSGNALRFTGIRFGRYPEYFAKACYYAERRFARNPASLSPRILFVPKERAHFLWLHGVENMFIKIPTTQLKPRFLSRSRIIVDSKVITGFDDNGNAELGSTPVRTYRRSC